eukprot:Nitzschia sp. Nitz4//scaffold49_size126201//59877//61004//NITZ4_003642-RA/size126201-processed-gene-0.173-mRNA-1//-1//CDS//3329553149//7296//frame0
MSPADFVSARTTESNHEQKETTRVTVNGQVYMPFLSYDAENSEESLKHIVATMFDFANNNHRAGLQVSQIQGGITNQLYRISGLPCEPRVVLVRIFGAIGMIDRDVETATYAALAEQGVALEYYGRFGNGRLEQWLEGQTHLDCRQLSDPDISRGIATNLARLHSDFVIPEDLQSHHNPNQRPTLWTQLNDWWKKADAQYFSDPSEKKRVDALHLSRLGAELKWLESDVCSSTAAVGFCHNDLLAANILHCPTSGRIQLIDFEYGGINYLSYDVANHFNEFAGGTGGDATPDYSLFPTQESQYTFCETYLEVRNSTTPTEAQVHQLLNEVTGFVLANHLVWGLWAINQAATEGCEEFDYIQYGTCRITRYWQEKE